MPHAASGSQGATTPDPHSVGCKTQTRFTHSQPQELVMTDGQPSEGRQGKSLPAAVPDSRIHSFVSSVSQLSFCLLFQTCNGNPEWELSLEKRGNKKRERE